jgi:hypothetical protein
MLKRLVPVVLVLAAVGCGGGGEEGEVRDALRAFSQAAIDGDGEQVCDGLAKSVRDQFAAGGGDCADIVTSSAATFKQQAEKNLDEIDDIEVEVDGDSATITKDGESTTMTKEDGEWKLTGN